MRYLKMQNKILECDAAVSMAFNGGEVAARRLVAFIRLLTWFAEKPGRSIMCARQANCLFRLKRRFDTMAVWDACVIYGVLRRNEYGFYDAYEWLNANDLIETEGEP